MSISAVSPVPPSSLLSCCNKVSSTDVVFRDNKLSCPCCGHQLDAPRVSPSRISVLQVPDFCPRCFYLLLKLSFKTAFDHGTPYVMQLMDRHQKRVAGYALSDEGELPKFFGAFRTAKRVIPVDWLSCYHPGTNLQLFGYPDLVFEFDDETAGIIDDKTALAKRQSHPLFHMYRAQTSLYKFMMEHGPSPRKVSRLGLLYYEFKQIEDEQMPDSFNDEEVWMPFAPRLVEVDGEKSDQLVNALLKKLRSFLDLSAAPEGRKGCKDCKAVADAWAQVSDYIEPTPSKLVDHKEFERRLSRWKCKMADGDRTADIVRSLCRSSTNKYGVLANWE